MTTPWFTISTRFGWATALVACAAGWYPLTAPSVHAASPQPGAMRKVDSVLQQAYRRAPGVLPYQAKTATATQVRARSANLSSAPPLVSGGYIKIEAYAQGDSQQLAADLAKLGLVNSIVNARSVSGRLPVKAISQLDGVASLRFARPVWATTRAGAVTSQGDLSQASANARASFGLTGAGVRVGVLSDSFNDSGWGSVSGDIASNDLPGDTQVVSDLTGGGNTDEGRAMAQIVHDVAPGSGIAFYTAFNGQADFAAGILALAGSPYNCKVITDDVIYYTEPMFADGVIAQAVDTVKAAGVAYFSSAGNDARNSFEDGPFRLTRVEGFYAGSSMHSFGRSRIPDTLLNITLGTGQTIFVLQWNQPYYSTQRVPGNPGATGDIDIFLCAPDGAYLVDADGYPIAGTSYNIGADPTEAFAVYNDTGSPMPMALSIEYSSGAAPTLMKLVWFGSTQVSEYPANRNKGTIYGHCNAQGANAVGAVRYYRSPVYGQTPPTLESFSSAGFTDIHLDIDGQVLATPRHRPKPEFCAPDGGNTTFFFPGTDFPEGDGWPNFYGTSAAAPHAAGVAALMLQAKPAATPDEIRLALQGTAIDMLTAGFDYDTGYGLIQADAAVRELTQTPPPSVVGDFNNDSRVNMSDLVILQNAIRLKSNDPQYDVNKDGRLNAADARYEVQLFTKP